MFCGECGTENPENNRFCKNCGKPLRKSTAAEQPGPAVPGPVGIPPAPSPALPVPLKKRTVNWIGIAGLACALLSWGILTVLLVILAVILGTFSLYITRKETGKIAISAVAAIIIALASIAGIHVFG